MINMDTTNPCTFKTSSSSFKEFVSLLTYKKDLPDVSFKNILVSANTTMCSTGIASKPTPGFISIGNNKYGKSIFAMEKLLKSKAPQLGRQRLQIASDLFNYMGVFRSAAEKKKYDGLADLSDDQFFWDDLTKSSEKDDVKGFIDKVLVQLRQTKIAAITWSKEDQSSLISAFCAFELFQVWGRISPSQKGLGLSSIVNFSYRFTNGQDMRTRFILDPSENDPGISMLDAMSFLTLGINSFSLVRHWYQLNAINNIAGGKKTSEQVAKFAKNYQLLGQGLKGSVTSDIDEGAITKAGFRKAPQFGIGALFSDNPQAKPPKEYQSAPLPDKLGVLGIPASNVHSIAGAIGDGTLVGTGAGKGSVSESAYKIFKSWPKSTEVEKYNSVVGGSALAGHLWLVAMNNPYLFGGIVAAFSYINCVDKKDDDYKSNDIAYLGSLFGIQLSRILYGGKSKTVDEEGEAFSDLTESNLGYPKEFNKDGYKILVDMFRIAYWNIGLKSKADCYQLSNQAYADKRLNETDTTVAQYVFNMLFDEHGYDMASNILSGKARGLTVAKTLNDSPVQIYVVGNDELSIKQIAQDVQKIQPIKPSDSAKTKQPHPQSKPEAPQSKSETPPVSTGDING